MRKDNDKKTGFTIIEVTLVIAVAGLIFLMVFVAVPSMQRLARDTQRKEDVTTLMREIKDFATNNRGVFPDLSTEAKGKAFADKYIGNFKDPDGTDYRVQSSNGNYVYTNNASGNKGGMDHKMHVQIGARCDGENAVKTENPRNIAIIYRLEGSGVYCDDM